MKAARIHQHGGTDVLVYEDAPDPQIKANQVLVRVRACALNHLDLFIRAGIPGMKFAMPHILGADIAGEIIAVGDLAERVDQDGDHIFIPVEKTIWGNIIPK